MRRYHRREWQAFRREVLELDGHQCVRCHRGPTQGATLQVHHKLYHPGKLPWQYAHGDCETLCKGCHAGEHGITKPFVGWNIDGYDDLGALNGECDLCGTPLRHVFIISHPKWPTLEVGEMCCDHLTSTTSASEHLVYEKRRRRFITSSRWKPASPGSTFLNQKGIRVVIRQEGVSTFRILAEGIAGREHFISENAARGHLFDLFENGRLERYLARLRNVHRR